MKNLLIKILLVFLIFYSGSAYAGHLKFIQFTDVHFSTYMEDKRDLSIKDSPELLNKAIEEINARKDIDFVVFSGDNIDEPDGDSLVEFLKITKKFNKPYYIGIGNHDVLGCGLSKSKYLKLVDKYNKNQKNKTPNFCFKAGKDFIVIFMDGVIQTIPTSHGCFLEDELEWLEGVLEKNRNKKAIIVQHFPLVEPKEFKSHRTKRIEGYKDLLSRYDNILMVVSGHYHYANVIEQDGIYHISSPAFTMYPYRYRIIEVDTGNSGIDVKTELIPLIKN